MSIILDGSAGITTPNIVSPIQTISTKLDLTGGQIKFPATQVPSSDANTLDDYEEGTFTTNWGTWSDTQPSIGNGTISGYYIKIGNLINLEIRIQGGSTTNYGVGWYKFSLPFFGTILPGSTYGTGYVSNNSYNTRYLMATEVNNTFFYGLVNAAGGYGIFTDVSPIAMAGCGAGGVINFNLSYMIS